MKSQTSGSPVKGTNTAVVVAEQQPKTLFAYGTITTGKGRKQVTRRVAVAGIQTGPTALRLGIAVCSLKDKFVKAKGRTIALGRAKSTKPEDVLYLTDDTSIVQQFISRVSKLITLSSRKESNTVGELSKLN